MVIPRWLAGTAILALFVGLLFLMLPRPSDLAEVEVRSADVQQAVRLLQHQSEVRPHDLNLKGQLATACERADRPGDGLVVLQEIARNKPLTPNQRSQVRRLALADARPARAFDILSQPNQPRGATELSDLASLATVSHHADQALVFQTKLVMLRPNSARDLMRLVGMAQNVGQYKAARDAQAKLVSLAASPESVQLLIQLDEQVGDPKAALAALVHYAPPRDAKGLRTAYQLAVMSQQPAIAVTYMWEEYRQGPTLALGKLLAQQLSAVKDPRATAFLAGLYAAFPHDRPLQELHLNQLVSSGRIVEAYALLQKAIHQDPVAVEPHRRLVSFALGHAKQEVALAELQRWTARFPTDRDALHQLAVVQVWTNHSVLAWATYSRLFAAGGTERAWREAWLHISQLQDDASPAGLANLQFLVARSPDRLPLLRRLAAAQLDQGHAKEALQAQEAVAALPGATTGDVTTLARWSLWYNRTDRGLDILQAAEARSPLPLSLLDEAIGFAARAHRFDRASWFLKRETEREPRNTDHLERLAAVQEYLGDLAAATRSLERRYELDPGQASQRSQLLSLLVRQHRTADAVTAIVRWRARASIDELRFGVELAQGLGSAVDERTLLMRWVEVAPRSAAALVALATFEQAGHDPSADGHFQAALALAPDDVGLLTRMAAVRLYGPQPEAAGPFVRRLEPLPDLQAESLRVIADFESSRHAAQAAAALDALHALHAGDASTHLQRANLATALGDNRRAATAYEEAVALGSQAKDERGGEAVAQALEALGRSGQARERWGQLAATYPSNVASWVALARLALQAHDLEGSQSFLMRAEALQPLRTEVRAARAEWLRAGGHYALAADSYQKLHLAQPLVTYWAAAEAESRNSAGQHHAAKQVARLALARAPTSPDLIEAYRRSREQGSNQTGFHALTEGYAGFDRQSFGLSAVAPLGDALRMGVSLDQLAWSGGALQTHQVAVTLAGEAGMFTGGLAVQLQRQLTGIPLDQGPLGELNMGIQNATSSLMLTLSEDRWADTNALVLAGGRHHAATLEARWQPDARLMVRANGGVGQLVVPGQEAGTSTKGLLEVALHPNAASPWGLYGQVSYHGWGAIGLANGLPDHLTSENLSIGYANRLGPWLLNAQPGVGFDASFVPTPTLNASLAWDVSTDTALELLVGWSGRSLGIGQAGAYTFAQLQGHWWF